MRSDPHVEIGATNEEPLADLGRSKLARSNEATKELDADAAALGADEVILTASRAEDLDGDLAKLRGVAHGHEYGTYERGHVEVDHGCPDSIVSKRCISDAAT